MPKMPKCRNCSRLLECSVESSSRECLLFADQTLSIDTVNEPSMRHFWETLTTSVTARESGGHVDIFVPLVETGEEVNKLIKVMEIISHSYLRDKPWPNARSRHLKLHTFVLETYVGWPNGLSGFLTSTRKS